MNAQHQPTRSIDALHLTAGALALVALTLLGGCTSLGPDYTGLEERYPAGQFTQGLRRGVYLAAGLGVSRLEPDTVETPQFQVSDSAGSGAQVAVGADINKWVSVEMHHSELGSAEFSPAGRINYQFSGVSALLYGGGNRNNFRRQGMSAYGRLGIGTLKNSQQGNLPYTQNHSVQQLFGAGLEYVLGNGIGARAEILWFDTDATYAQIGLNYRLAKRQQSRVRVAQHTPRAVGPVYEVKDTDNDGVTDRADSCPYTQADTSVDNTGCALFAGVIEGVNFHTNSAQLTPVAQDSLNAVASTLLQYPAASVEIKAHTDNHGSESYNQRLSEQRARSVLRHLNERGVARTRMHAKAYGERTPIATNQTEEGRRRNRRVELFSRRLVTQ